MSESPIPPAESAPHPLGPLTGKIDEATITELIQRFYGKLRVDPTLGPIFERQIGATWDEHLVTIADFWSNMALRTRRYMGRPMGAHFKIPDIAPEHFAIWLAAWFETVEEVCPPEAQEFLKARAAQIAESFKAGLFYRPALHDPHAKAPETK
ncbi:MAG: group III truncated hemoglobin [Parvibaculaceae bacterium]|jgi:hemoglobin|nr:group III truncated hemoglobin [Parvibaculaceae bacterium]